MEDHNIIESYVSRIGVSFGGLDVRILGKSPAVKVTFSHSSVVSRLDSILLTKIISSFSSEENYNVVFEFESSFYCNTVGIKGLSTIIDSMIKLSCIRKIYFLFKDYEECELSQSILEMVAEPLSEEFLGSSRLILIYNFS